MAKKLIPITLDRIADPDNLQLALIRIYSSKPNKRIRNDRSGINLIRENIDTNLDKLSKEIINGYKPSRSLKVYMPKSFIHTRVMSILSAKDEIVYQAIINLLAQNAYHNLEILQKHNSYGHKIHPHVCYGTEVLHNADHTTNFFDFNETSFENWEEFTETTNQEILREGNNFKFETDITSFYDSIPLDQLLHAVSKYGLNKDSSNLLFHCLKQWTGNKKTLTCSVGIPTGPNASAFIANLYLMPVDLHMIRQPIKKYLRYVDDFRLFTNDRKELERVAPMLGILLRGLGLSLKSSKTNVEEIDKKLTLAQYFGADEYSEDATSVYYDKNGKAYFIDYNPNYFLNNQEYQEKNLRNLIHDLKEFFSEESGIIKFKDKELLLKKKNDGVISQILTAYKVNIIQCMDNFGFEPDESIIEIIFFLINNKQLLHRSHVYIPFLGIYSNNIEIRNRIFELLEKRMSENMEWIRYLIYETLMYFKLDQSQSERLIEIFPNEELWASEKLHFLLTRNCFKDEENKILAIQDIWDEKCHSSPINFYTGKELDEIEVDDAVFQKPQKIDEKKSLTYEDDFKPICVRLDSINPDGLNEEERELFYNVKWAHHQSKYFSGNYRDQVLPPLIEYLRADNHICIHVDEVQEITELNLSPFWRAVSIRSLPVFIKRDYPQIVSKDLKVVIEDHKGNKNPKKDVLNIAIKKIPI